MWLPGSFGTFTSPNSASQTTAPVTMPCQRARRAVEVEAGLQFEPGQEDFDFVFFHQAERTRKKRGIESAVVSLSHTEHYAVAMAMLVYK